MRTRMILHDHASSSIQEMAEVRSLISSCEARTVLLMST